jgi:VCBS repeat-containing protein
VGDAVTDKSVSADDFATLKSGLLSVFDTQLTALYLQQTAGAGDGLSLNTLALTGISGMATQYAGAIQEAAGGTSYVLIDATARGGDATALLASLNALGMVNGSVYGAMASGWMPVSALSDMVGLSTLAFARENAILASAGTVTAQADHAQGNDLTRSTYNVDGTGLKIGVLSDSFNTPGHNGFDGAADTMAVDIARGDLPTDTTVLQDQTSGTDEGRAMAQLIHDLAPGASIAFATAYNGQAGFANNIIALANAGAKVIVDDVRYYYEPAYQNGVIAQAVNTVVSQGVTYFSSAGNSGFEGYESTWHNGAIGSASFDNDQMLSFAPGQDFLAFTATGRSDIFNLQWDQPAASAGGAGSASDVDFWVTNAAGTILASSLANNLGGDPVEGISFKGVAGQTYYLRVGLYAGPTPGEIKITSFSAPLATTAYNFNDGTTYGHNSAQGAIAVGAADYRSTPNFGVSPPQLEYFSSGGPVTLLFDDAGNRLATGITSGAVAFVAVDGSDTSFFGSDADGNGKPNFFGTSAAAPDAAAAALLMLQANSGLTPDDIRALLVDTALDMDNPDTAGFDVGADAGSGAGLIRTDLAVQAVRTGVITNTTLSTVYGTHFADDITAGSGANTILAGAGDDRLKGAGGNDTLDGGAGTDTAVFTGARANYTVTAVAGGFTVTDTRLGSPDGTDTLKNVELAQFSDQTITLGGVSNQPPVLSHAVVDQSINEDAAFSFTVPADSFSDPDAGDSLTYSATLANGAALPAWLSFNTATRTFSGTPANGDVGVISVKVTATDTGAASASDIFDLTVANTNDAPTVAHALTAQGATEDAAFTFVVPANTFADVDVGDTLTYAATLASGAALPAWLTFDASTHTFSGTPANGDVGSISVKVTVTDSGAATASSTFALSVANTNDAPVLSGPNSGQVTEDGTLTVSGQLVDTDPDAGATAAWSVVGPASGTYGSFGVNASGLWTYTLDNAAAQPLTAGDHPTETYTVKVDDGQGGTDTRLVTITINGADEAGGPITGTAGNDILTGSSGDDSISGLAGNDSLYGGGGNDLLIGGAGNDILNGGAGVDTAVYTDATAGVKLSLAIAAAQVTGGSGTDTVSGIENITGSDFNDTLTGDAGANVLIGGLGNDTLDGGAGADTLIGGAGNDVYMVDNAADVIIETAGNGTDTVRATAASYVLSAEVESLTYTGAGAFNGTGNASANTLTGGAGADTLSGVAGDDKLYGGAGNDALYGGDGNDAIDGGAGDDLMDGGLGNDTYTVDSAADVIVEAAGAGTDTVKASAASYTLSDNIETLTYTGAAGFKGTGNAIANTLNGGAGADTLYGLAGDDKLTALAGDDSLYGGDGKDTLDGGVGADLMDGGLGDDTYLVDNAGDVVVEGAGGGTDTVKTGLSAYTLTSDVETLVYTGAATFSGTGNASANTVTGGADNDVLSGLGGADKLNGAAGNDLLAGGAGADTLTGGAGADAFVYTDVSESTAAATDTIVDFHHAEGDYLDLSAIDADTGLAGDQAFTLIGTAAFSHTAGELRYQVSGSTLTLQADVNGDGVADMTIKLTGVTSLSATDFHP